jgi:hypothetical protein
MLVPIGFEFPRPFVELTRNAIGNMESSIGEREGFVGAE